MRHKLLFWLFLIAECLYDARVQCQSNDAYSFKKRLAVNSRITGGDKYESKDRLVEYPWLVGFHDRKNERFFCAGSLISNRHVLSAAHCFHYKGLIEAIDPYQVLAMLGRFNVSDHDEAGSLNSLVWEIFIHPDWNFADWKSNYDADISVAVLEDLVEFTAFIRPVRLPDASNKSEVVGDGTVVGWGHDNKSPEKEHEETPSKIEVLAVLLKTCLVDAREFLDGHSQRTFCAVFMGRAIAPCTGNSGGGFYVEDENEQNSIEGIVSDSATQDTPGECKTDIHTTYTIVANFVPWVKEKMQETRERVVKDVEYTCEYQGTVAACEAGENDNPLQDSVRFTLRGYQGNLKDVRTLFLNFGKTRVIEGISETFPNLIELQSDSNLPNRIERRTFANMTNLKTFTLFHNELITDHFFDDFVNLEKLELHGCRMPKEPKNLFNVLRNLKILILNGGAVWQILPDETFAKMSKLEELTFFGLWLEEISENAFKDLVEIKNLSLSGHLIAKLPAGLFNNLRSLKMINLNGNKIEILSREIFANNLMLEEIDLRKNEIKRIETDFTALPKIREIWLWDNVCVDASFGWSSDDSRTKSKTVQKFQEIIDAQCTA